MAQIISRVREPGQSCDVKTLLPLLTDPNWLVQLKRCFNVVCSFLCFVTDARTYTQDGVCLTESGLSHLQSLVEPLTSPRRYRR